MIKNIATQSHLSISSPRFDGSKRYGKGLCSTLLFFLRAIISTTRFFRWHDHTSCAEGRHQKAPHPAEEQGQRLRGEDESWKDVSAACTLMTSHPSTSNGRQLPEPLIRSVTPMKATPWFKSTGTLLTFDICPDIKTPLTSLGVPVHPQDNVIDGLRIGDSDRRYNRCVVLVLGSAFVRGRYLLQHLHTICLEETIGRDLFETVSTSGSTPSFHTHTHLLAQQILKKLFDIFLLLQ